MHAQFGGDQEVRGAIDPPELMTYLRTALGTELVDENGEPFAIERGAALDSYYATISVSDRFLPGQQLGPLVLQSIRRFVHTFEDAGDEPAQYAEAVAEYVLKQHGGNHSGERDNHQCTLEGVMQRANGRRE